MTALLYCDIVVEVNAVKAASFTAGRHAKARKRGKTMERLNMESIEKISLLYDFYGGLLTEKQRQVMELYHEENLSLAEIAQEFGISRQGVHDTLKKAEHLLTEYENKLGLVAKLMKSRQAIAEIDDIIDRLTESAENKESAAKLQEIKDIINRLEE